MRQHILILVACAALATPPLAHAGEILPGSPKAALAAELKAREIEGWRYYRERNVAAMTAMTSDDFADLYSGGEVVDRKRWIADMYGVHVDRSRLRKWHAFDLAGDVILFTYDGEAWGRDDRGRPLHNHAAVTSAWAKRDGRWLNVFYGEAALDPGSVITGGKPAGTGRRR